MKPQMFSKEKMEYLFFHLLDGFGGSHKGLKMLRDQGLVSEEEYKDLLEKNAERLMERVREFKMINKILSFFFACLFCATQIFNHNTEARRFRTRMRLRMEEETETIIIA